MKQLVKKFLLSHTPVSVPPDTHVACDKRSMCCMWFAHTWPYMLEAVCGTVRRLQKILDCTFQCDHPASSSSSKWSQKVLLHADLVTPRQGQGQWKWYQMVEVNGAYKHGRYEKVWLNSLHVMSNDKVFATLDGQLAGQRKHDSLHISIWYYRYHCTIVLFISITHYFCQLLLWYQFSSFFPSVSHYSCQLLLWYQFSIFLSL